MHTLFLLLRRSASFLYDCLLLVAVFFIITTALVLLNDGEKIQHPLFYLLLWIIGGMFFDGFWRRGGQTLGMRAWHVRVVPIYDRKNMSDNIEHDNSKLTPKQTWLRYAWGTILFGLGFLWAFVDADRHTANDRLSGTKIIKVSKHLKNKA